MATKLIKTPETSVVPQEEPEGAMMGFFDHLEEFRFRMFRAIMGLGVGMGIAFFFTNLTIRYMESSYVRFAPGHTLITLDPTESITVFFRVALMLGAIIASPIILYQILAFVVPALTRQEKRWLFLSLPAASGLFIVGVVITWTFLVPAYISFLVNFQSDVFTVNWTADNYVGFVTKVLFWHGAAFETPVVFYILGRLGMVTAGTMLKYWRHAVVAASLIAGFIAPTIDPLTMIVITIMLVALYGLSVLLVAATSGLKRDVVPRRRR